jgi:hypothetical protein
MCLPLNLLCPACHTPLPADAEAVVTCLTCAAEVDVTRAGTISGRPRFVPEIDRTGSDVDGFRVESRLGGGGMGTVYRAASPDGAPVALKFLAPALADNPDVVARFAREIATLARLEHPAIVRVLAHGTHEGTPWFAMALVDGSDLRARIASGALSPAETAAVFGRLFAALAHAHDRGVVHRDLKPANVLLGDAGAQLADFGIARLEAEMLTAPMVTRLTETAAVLGTLPYMSPEQRRGGALDRRSDLFSAGVMLYEAATGTLPQGAFPPPSEMNRSYGRAFDRVVMQLLQTDPGRRPTSAAQVATALAAALAPRRLGPRSLAAAAGALALLLVGGTIGARAMLRGGDGKRADKESLAATAPEAPKPVAPAERPSAAATEAATGAPERQALPEMPPPAADAKAEEMPPLTDDGKKPRLGKIKRRVVLRAVSDVKKLRAGSSMSGVDRPASGKLDKLIKAGKPIPPVITGGTGGTGGKMGKKSRKAESPAPDFDEVDAELKEAIPAASRVEESRPAGGPDGGAEPALPKRK